jgi:hypothetical protein
MEVIAELTVFHLILVSYTGALIGELTRSVECSEPISLVIFLAELLASGFLGIMIALALESTILKDKPIGVLAASGIFGYLDRKTCISIVNNLAFIKIDNKNNLK